MKKATKKNKQKKTSAKKNAGASAKTHGTKSRSHKGRKKSPDTKTAKKRAVGTENSKASKTGTDRLGAKRLSALDAAAAVLSKAKRFMRCSDLIAAMAKQNLWKSPRGKTPEATLSAAILREIGSKGREAASKRSIAVCSRSTGGGHDANEE